MSRQVWELPGQTGFFPPSRPAPAVPDVIFSSDDPNTAGLTLEIGDRWLSTTPPVVTPPPSSVFPLAPTMARPSGAGFVRYEDLYQPGDVLSQTLARLGTGSPNANSDGTGYITFPEGVFACTDFYGLAWQGNTTAQYGIYIPHNCLGLIGSGPGVAGQTSSGTIFTIVANSSTVPKIPQTGSGGSNNLVPNSCNLMYHGTGTKSGALYRYEQFQVIGTTQQNTYFGFTVKNPAGNAQFKNLIGFGGYCDNGAPPGETFILGMSGGNGPHLFENIYIDGNNIGGSITAEDTVNMVWRNVLAKNGITHEMVLYQAFNTTTYDCIIGAAGANSAVHQHQPTFNHERTAGTKHYRLVQTGVIPNINDNFVHSNDTYTATIDGVACSTVNGSLTFIDVSGIQPSQGQYIQIETGYPYNTSGFNGNTITTPPLVLEADGVTHVPYKWYRDSLGTQIIT